MSISRIVPTLRYDDAPKMIDGLRDALGFSRHLIADDGASGIGHAQLVHGHALIMLGSARDDEFDARQVLIVVDRTVSASSGWPILEGIVNGILDPILDPYDERCSQPRGQPRGCRRGCAFESNVPVGRLRYRAVQVHCAQERNVQKKEEQPLDLRQSYTNRTVT